MPMMPATGAALGTNRAERDRIAVNLALARSSLSRDASRDLGSTAQSEDTIVVSWHPTPDHTGEAWMQRIDL